MKVVQLIKGYNLYILTFGTRPYPDELKIVQGNSYNYIITQWVLVQKAWNLQFCMDPKSAGDDCGGVVTIVQI